MPSTPIGGSANERTTQRLHRACSNTAENPVLDAVYRRDFDCHRGHHLVPAMTYFPYLILGVSLVLFNHELPPMDWQDYVAFVLFFALIHWCCKDSIPTIDGDGHESARKSIAFRLGKKLNRILHYRFGNTAR